ncbi:pentatricopeptide repeat-containing protein [Skeletonema marinoi]|uniref:Pentatricopeptide repeat-containing protein n=1 Tax=Skeletonema marinoi TaxID=267567 RepID=A0AAD8XS17_9STRA|nr:pentatricopeptide repeat-containing protein [Skeletonema marinoi]
MKCSLQMNKSITAITTALILCTLTTQCCCFVSIKDGTNRLAAHYSTLSEEAQTATQPPNFSATATFNHDIARTLFPPLFFTLYHKYSNQNQQDDQEIAIRQHLKRSSPFTDPSSAQTAERMLRRMMENRYRSDGRTVCPDNRTFNLVAGSYGRLRCRNGVTKVPNIGVVWEEEPKLDPQYRMQMNNNNIDATEEMISMTSTDKLQELLQLQLCLCHYEGWPDEIRPSVDIFKRVLRRLAWRSGNIELNSRKQTSDAEQALQWLKFMNTTLPQQFALEGKHATICSPDSTSMSYVIEALASHRVQAYSERKGTSKHHKTLPTVNISITEMANEMDVQLESTSIPQEVPFSALQKAEELLLMQEEMYELHRNDKAKQALAHSYKCLLEGFGRYAVTSGSSQNDAIKRAHELLCRLEALCDAPSSSYASVIFALSISNRPSAAAVAEEVLNRMLSKLNSDQVLNANDVSKAFSGCIAAYVKNHDAKNADKILFEMIKLYESDELGSDFVPEPRAFGTCIAAWSKYDPTSEKSNDRGRRWVSSPRQRLHNADRAESILVELERVARKEAAKNTNKYVLHATPYNIAILARVQTLETISPKTRWSNEGIILHAQSILEHMEFEMGVAADPYTYSTLLNAWTKQSCPGNEKAADYAEELLRRRIEDVDISKIYSDDDPSAKTVDDVWPNVKHYSSVLKAHANCRSPAGARKALSLLSEMEKRFYDAKVISDEDDDADFHVDQKDAAKPDLVCYSIVIDAFAKQKQLSESSSVAFRLLRAMEEKYHAGDMSMKPNNRIYTAVILSLAQSPYTGDDAAELNNAQRAWSLLDEMKANDVQPNSFTYNYIINCCAQEASHDENEQRISFEIAIKAFQELRKMAASSNNNDDDSCSTDAYHPDSFTYAFTLKACTNLLPPSPFRTKVATQVFKESCKKGYCNDEVMKRLRWCVDTDNFHELIGTDARDVRINDMPSSWSRCCLPSKRRR